MLIEMIFGISMYCLTLSGSIIYYWYVLSFRSIRKDREWADRIRSKSSKSVNNKGSNIDP